MKPEHSGSNLPRDSGATWQAAEEQLRRVCREQRATIERIEAENADLRRRLGEHGRYTDGTIDKSIVVYGREFEEVPIGASEEPDHA